VHYQEAPARYTFSYPFTDNPSAHVGYVVVIIIIINEYYLGAVKSKNC